MLYIVLTSIIQESTNGRYPINVEDLLWTNTITQKDKKPHTAGLDVPQYRTLKYKLPKYRLKIKKAQYRSTVNPNAPSSSKGKQKMQFKPDKGLVIRTELTAGVAWIFVVFLR